MNSHSNKSNQQRQPLSHLTTSGKIQHFHALWISDVHLGSIDCKAEFLLHFLNHSQCQYLYLVGDIIDIWALKKRVFWPESHNNVIQKILELASNGTQVIYIPGNHDEAFKSYADSHFRGITLAKQYVHQSINGKRFLILHGDQFDAQVCVSRIYAKLGDHLYDVLLWSNRQLHSVRSRLGYPYWSLASYIKLRVNKAQQAINQYRDAVLRYCAKQQVDMVICGHIHQPELSQHTINNRTITYANDGDWVENCTLIAETQTGNVELLKWDEQTLQAKVVNTIYFGASQTELIITPQPQHVA
ncbi:UDP-2,3-diacylglucosamine diphosphatase [Shewanella sp. SR43-4]|uniref:UDP-2,3-diacylglucosamine diphosphatase n=1 Tax=Shewanella sp. SR43-4 TaxID=2760942 RepID=UPI0015FBDA11|nr:UDP-2,3-diacylglucosamine diphosphatase [Shewanella sp. SR43-4]MBB1316868.1 UDP-2,3-diacylglucosamine diphosphatase [Shewanella sp. SR43-4]